MIEELEIRGKTQFDHIKVKQRKTITTNVEITVQNRGPNLMLLHYFIRNQFIRNLHPSLKKKSLKNKRLFMPHLNFLETFWECFLHFCPFLRNADQFQLKISPFIIEIRNC